MPRGSRHLAEPTAYRHPDTGQERTATTKVEAISYEADGFRRAAVLDGDVEPADTSHLEQFDPSAKSVAEVNTHLADAAAAGDFDEVDRVIAVEASGKNRATVRAPETTESNVDPAE